MSAFKQKQFSREIVLTKDKKQNTQETFQYCLQWKRLLIYKNIPLQKLYIQKKL